MAAITVMTFSACGAAPTPLYPQYQESFGLTPFMLTIIFAAYVVSLLAALLTGGSQNLRVPAHPLRYSMSSEESRGSSGSALKDVNASSDSCTSGQP